jgi:hypothetical protein
MTNRIEFTFGREERVAWWMYCGQHESGPQLVKDLYCTRHFEVKGVITREDSYWSPLSIKSARMLVWASFALPISGGPFRD